MNKQHSLSRGDRIQWYQIEDVLGQGGFGITYLATDTNLHHKVAIKEFLPQPIVARQTDSSLQPVSDAVEEEYRLGLQRFLNEARTLVKFRHPNIVRVMAVFEANNTAYLVMEYEQGERFREHVQRAQFQEEAHLKFLLLSVADGLHQVHENGFIHRDIKPVNLIIRDDGNPVLLDFGSARPTVAASRQTSFVSTGYAPLEQYQKGAGLSVGPWTDIYALAATFYFAISGQTPVSPVSRLAALVKNADDPLVRAVEVGRNRYSNGFLRNIDWALNFETDKRPQSLPEWRTALQAEPDRPSLVSKRKNRGQRSRVADTISSADLLTVDARPSAKTAAVGKRRYRWLLAALGVVLAVTGLGLLSYNRQQGDITRQLQQAVVAREQDDVDQAAQHYRQILQQHPGNTDALKGMNTLRDEIRAAMRGALENHSWSEAEERVNQLQRLRDPLSQTFRNEMRQLRRAREIEQQLSAIETLIDKGSFEQAESLLTNVSAANGADGFAQKRITALTDRLAAVQANRQQEAEQLAEQKAKQKAEQQRQRLRRQQERERLVALANSRQQRRRSEYRSYLSSAESALLDGNIPSARASLDKAQALQISDGAWRTLDNRVSNAETFEAQPLSQYEMRFARGRFNSLRSAVETQNLRALVQLTVNPSSRLTFFENLFDRYVRLKASVINVQSKQYPKRVEAVLRLEELGLPNGDVVYPSPSYRDLPIRIQRATDGWSKIGW